jgi:hypothetical protein
MSDSFLQIVLGRTYGAISQWPELAHDPLYRCRATSIVLTRLVDEFFGPWPFAHKLLNLLFHLANASLVGFAASRIPGLARSTPWIAAALFACIEILQEAVIWVAALPELLVFCFVMLALLAWQRAVDSRDARWLAAAALAFILALLSKESAVVFVPLAAGWWLWRDRQWRAPILALAVFTVMSLGYAAAIFAAKSTHLHLGDGTFSLSAPFWITLPVTIGRLLFPFGWVSLAVLALLEWKRSRRVLLLCALWIPVTLAPYAFLAYMTRIPSRHTYFAAAGVALLIAAGVELLRRHRGMVPAALFLALFMAGNAGYLWTKKYNQYLRRIAPTERFLNTVKDRKGAIWIRCAPYGHFVYQSAIHVRLGRPLSDVPDPKTLTASSGAFEYCDKIHP